MSEEAIVGKLREALRDSVGAECQVVYLLVEIRKLLHLRNAAQAFEVLNFYCNWVAHTSLELDAAKNFIARLNRSFSALSSGDTTKDWFQEIVNRLGFSVLRKQLRGFLRKEGLPSSICDDECQWQEFLYYYSLVIQDCPLLYEIDSNNRVRDPGAADLRFDKVVLTNVSDETNALNRVQIAIKWQFFRDRRLVFDLTDRPGRMVLMRSIVKPEEIC